MRSGSRWYSDAISISDFSTLKPRSMSANDLCLCTTCWGVSSGKLLRYAWKGAGHLWSKSGQFLTLHAAQHVLSIVGSLASISRRTGDPGRDALCLQTEFTRQPRRCAAGHRQLDNLLLECRAG
jgi:hypothetical protein